MGKPAARLMDPTAHGGMITGPGCPNVLRLFNAVNLECGYKTLAIHSPMEVTSYEKK